MAARQVKMARFTYMYTTTQVTVLARLLLNARKDFSSCGGCQTSDHGQRFAYMYTLTSVIVVVMDVRILPVQNSLRPGNSWSFTSWTQWGRNWSFT